MANRSEPGAVGRGGAGGVGEAHHAVVGDLQHELAVAVPIFHDVPCLRKQVRRSGSGDGRGRAAGCAHVQDAPRIASPPQSKRCPSPPRAPCGQPGRRSAQRGSVGRCKLVVTRQAAVRPAKTGDEGSHRGGRLRRPTGKLGFIVSPYIYIRHRRGRLLSVLGFVKCSLARQAR